MGFLGLSCWSLALVWPKALLSLGEPGLDSLCISKLRVILDWDQALDIVRWGLSPARMRHWMLVRWHLFQAGKRHCQHCSGCHMVCYQHKFFFLLGSQWMIWHLSGWHCVGYQHHSDWTGCPGMCYQHHCGWARYLYQCCCGWKNMGVCGH